MRVYECWRLSASEPSCVFVCICECFCVCVQMLSSRQCVRCGGPFSWGALGGHCTQSIEGSRPNSIIEMARPAVFQKHRWPRNREPEESGIITVRLPCSFSCSIGRAVWPSHPADNVPSPSVRRLLSRFPRFTCGQRLHLPAWNAYSFLWNGDN